MRVLVIAVWALIACLLTACHDDEQSSGPNEQTSKQEMVQAIRVGTIAGPETELMQAAAAVAKAQFDLDVKMIVFSDYIQPNEALNQGDLDANMFQHKPYLDEQSAEHHYQLAIAGKTFVYPMGLYSSRYKTLAEIPTHTRVAIPNDPTNEGRALLLLQKSGLITLKAEAGLKATVQEIAKNPKQLQFVELDAANLPRAFADVGLAVINTNYAIPAGLVPSQDAIVLEDKDSPYANLIVVRQADKDQPWVHELVKAFQSPQVADKAKQLFQDQAIPAWETTEITAEMLEDPAAA